MQKGWNDCEVGAKGVKKAWNEWHNRESHLGRSMRIHFEDRKRVALKEYWIDWVLILNMPKTFLHQIPYRVQGDNRYSYRRISFVYVFWLKSMRYIFKISLMEISVPPGITRHSLKMWDFLQKVTCRTLKRLYANFLRGITVRQFW